MTIQFSCPYCQAAINADNTYAGKQARCTTCSAIIVVPNATRPAPTPPPTPSPTTRQGGASANSQASQGIPFNCPLCRAHIVAPPSLAGQQAKCTTCQGIVRVPGGASPHAGAPAPAAGMTPPSPNPYASSAPLIQTTHEVFDEALSSQQASLEPTESRNKSSARPRRRKPNYRITSVGLWMVAIVPILLLLALVTFVGSTILAIFFETIEFLLAWLITLRLLQASVFCSIVGRLLCVTVPLKTGARGYIIANLMIDAFLVVIVGVFTHSDLGSIEAQVMVLALAINIVPMVSLIVFGIFVQKLTAAIGEEAIGEEVGHVISIYVMLVFISPLMRFFFIIGGLLQLVVAAYVCIRYTLLMFEAAAACGAYHDRIRRPRLR